MAQPDPVYVLPDDDDDDTQQPGQPAPKLPRPDDNTLAKRWLFNNPRVAWGMGEWRRYKDGIWTKTEADLIKNNVKKVIEAAAREGVRCTANLVSSTTELARLDVVVPSDLWDASANLLPCKNGVLDIPSRTLLPHTPSIYATSQLPFDYDPTATCPAFMQALQQIPDAIEFLQEFAGYSLTPDTKHETAIWLYGEPGTGKSTILEGLKAMLGSRAGILGLADIERSKFALSNLPGKTLVVSSEQPDSFISLSYLLNQIISGETVTVERKYFDAIDITPRAKIVWAMNNLPRISSSNDGIMRRVKVIKFPRLDASQRDPDLKERIKLEGAGILNWALEGLDRLRARGKFAIPQVVIDATEDFKEHNDIIKQFLEDANATINLLDTSCRTQSQYLYDQYKEWCIRNSHKPLSSTRMADEWKRFGFEKMKSAGVAYWQGVEISAYTSASNVP
jgi:putative DNA primase/helicase